MGFSFSFEGYVTKVEQERLRGRTALTADDGIENSLELSTAVPGASGPFPALFGKHVTVTVDVEEADAPSRRPAGWERGDVEVLDPDGYRCVLHPWRSEAMDEDFTAVSCYGPDDHEFMHAGMTKHPVTAEAALQVLADSRALAPALDADGAAVEEGPWEA